MGYALTTKPKPWGQLNLQISRNETLEPLLLDFHVNTWFTTHNKGASLIQQNLQGAIQTDYFYFLDKDKEESLSDSHETI